MNVIAKKSLGQNFLIDKKVIDVVVDTINIKDKIVLEVGPGTGNLTKALLEKKPKKLFAIEKDKNLETKYYLKKLNTKKVNHIGNLKFAKSYDERLNKIDKNFKKELERKKVWVASSTHKNEELFCIKAHVELKKTVNDLLTIIIPRHVHRTQDIISQIKDLNLSFCVHSRRPKNLKNVDIYIVDTFGETQKFHKIGSSVFLGGSIINRGGQNPLEAARYGAKILHGPNIDNFKDVYKLLKLLKISKKIQSSKQLSSSIIFNKNKGTGSKIKNIGEKILKKTIKEIDRIIINEFKKT